MPPVIGHGLIIKAIYRRLLPLEASGGFEVFTELPFVELYTPGWVKGSRSPDLMIYRTARLEAFRASNPSYKAMPFVIVPDICVEVISANDSVEALEERVDEYLQKGVQAVWIINPRARSITIYTAASIRRLTENQILEDVEQLPEFRITVSELF